MVEQAVYSAIGQFNDGTASFISVLRRLGINPGHFTTAQCREKDIRRIDCSKRKSTDTVMSRRKHLRAVRKGFLDKNAEVEGETYSKGAF